jgi:uncharacterized membrane protein
MARIGRRGRLWLRAFHIFFIGLWVGAIVSQVVILSFTGRAQSDGGLQAMYIIPEILNIVTGAGMFGTVVTGVLLAWLTPWGFFKHKWVIYSMSMVVIDLLIVFVLSDPLISKLSTLVEAEGLSALQNPDYISTWNKFIIVAAVCPIFLISAVFVSVIKPWRKHEEAKATT